MGYFAGNATGSERCVGRKERGGSVPILRIDEMYRRPRDQTTDAGRFTLSDGLKAVGRMVWPACFERDLKLCNLSNRNNIIYKISNGNIKLYYTRKAKE